MPWTDATIVGWGQSRYEKRTEHNALWFLSDVITQAVERAGLEKSDVDGLAITSFQLPPDNVTTVAEQLGLELRWSFQGAQGGASGVISILRAARAIEAGEAEVVVCAAADAFTVASHMDLMQQFNSAMRDYLAPHGFGGTNGLFALVQRRHMHEYGTTRGQLGQVAVTQRRNAQVNPNALLRDTLTMSDYLAARPIAEPIHLYDCVMPCAGADAVVLVAERVARRLRRNPVRIVAGTERHNHEPEQSVVLDTGLSRVSAELFAAAGCKPADLEFVQLYDDYPIMVLIQLEDLGFCEKGAGGRLLVESDFSRDGPTALNTGGGQLSCGQAGASGGMIGVVEAVAQLQQEAVGRQIRATVGLVTGFGMVGFGRGLSSSAVVLSV